MSGKSSILHEFLLKKIRLFVTDGESYVIMAGKDLENFFKSMITLILTLTSAMSKSNNFTKILRKLCRRATKIYTKNV